MKKEIELGDSFWVGISFAGGVFGFGWVPFVIIMLFGFLFHINKNDKINIKTL